MRLRLLCVDELRVAGLHRSIPCLRWTGIGIGMGSLNFKKAVKAESKLRMALAGPSGAGKTFTALSIATAMAGDGENGVAVIDTERGSASKYSDLFQFDVLELESFHPDRYIEAIQAAETAGYHVLVIDSITHEWNGMDGVLEQIDKICQRDKCTSIQAWAKATPMHRRFIDAMLSANVHIIVTMRSKMGVSIDKDERGKTTVQKVGMEAEQRNGIEYEFDVVGDLDRDNTMVVGKSRCVALAGQVIRKPGAQIAATLAEWLHGEPSADVADAPRRARAPIAPIAPIVPIVPIVPIASGAHAWLTDDSYDPMADVQLNRDLETLGISSMEQKEAILRAIRDKFPNDYSKRRIKACVAAKLRVAAPATLEGVEMGAPGN